jgi:hypothetical protein
MKKKISLSLLVCFSFMIIVSCTEDPQTIPLESYRLITGKTKKTWQLTSLQWTGDEKDDITYGLPNCIRDDVYVFYANYERLYEVRNGASKCKEEEADVVVSDQWSFVNAKSKLTIIFPLLAEGSLPFYVKKLTSKEMVIEIYLDQDSKYSYKMTLQSVSEE